MTPSRPQKTTWLILTFAFTMLPLLLVFVGLSSNRGGQSAAPNHPMSAQFVICAFALTGAVYWALARMRPGLPPQKFQSETLVALAFSEFCTLYAFVSTMQGDRTPLFIAAAANVLVNLAVILPAGLRYWSTQ